jgi:hypothetical protein
MGSTKDGRGIMQISIWWVWPAITFGVIVGMFVVALLSGAKDYDGSRLEECPYKIDPNSDKDDMVNIPGTSLYVKCEVARDSGGGRC